MTNKYRKRIIKGKDLEKYWHWKSFIKIVQKHTSLWIGTWLASGLKYYKVCLLVYFL